MIRPSLLLGFVATATLLVSVDGASAAPVRVVRGTDAGAFSSAQQAFLRSRAWRTRAYGAFDARLGAEWFNLHAFALDPVDATAHPGWVLKDSGGLPVYIGSKVAADVGNAQFRAWWIAKAQAAVASGYTGLFIDDVFMERRFTTVSGTARMPIDPRTGYAMTEANWQKQMADFMVAVRAALPAPVEIVHDVLWYKGDSGDVLRELQSATSVSLDKGFNDSAVGAGSGTYGFATLAGWVEREQVRGGSVVLDSSATATTDAARLYGLASYLLVDNGGAAIANDGSTAPGAFWSAGYNLDLGAPAAARYSWANVWRRDFAGGFVLVNEPGRATRTLTIPAGYQDLGGTPQTSVTLPAGSGIVLVPTPPPAPVSTPVPTPEAPIETSAPVAPVPVAPPRTPVVSTPSTGTKAGVASVGRRAPAGAAAPDSTRTTVRGSAARLSGTVRGAVAGQVRLTVERKRGAKWVVARRVTATVKRGGSFSKDIPRLSHGTYRVTGSFLGTGTSEPSRSSAAGFHA